jgi:tetratricopeptide (TPR) repeat protein
MDIVIEEEVVIEEEIPRPPRYSRAFRTGGRWLLFSITFLAPWFFLPLTTDSVGINKLVIIGFLVAAASVCFLGTVFEERTLDYPRTWFALFLVLFIAAEIVSTTFSIAPTQSWFGYLNQPDSLIAIFLYGIIFYLSFFFFRRNDIVRVGLCAAAGLVVAVFIGFVQMLGTASTFNPSGSWGAWGILIAAVLASLAAINPRKIFFIVALGATLALFFLNYQFIWIAIAIFVIALAAVRFDPNEGFRYAFIIIILAFFFALIGSRLPLATHIPPDVRPGIEATVDTTGGALSGWRALVGTGPSTFPLDFQAFRPASVNTTILWNTTVVPQGYDFILTLLATGGIFTWLFFLAMIVTALQWFLKIQLLSPDRAMVLACAAFLIFALFVYQAFFAELVLLFIILGLFVAGAPRRIISFEKYPRAASFGVSIVIMILAAGLLAATYVEGERYVAAIFGGKSDAFAAAGDINNAFLSISSAVELDHSDIYLRNASDILLQEARRLAGAGDATSTSQLAPIVANAIQAAQAAAQSNVRDAANWGNLGSIYESVLPLITGSDQFAEQSYAQAAIMDPQDPQWDFAMARTFTEAADLLPTGPSAATSRKADWIQAETYLEKALALKDDYTDARIALINLYIKEGNVAQAIEKVQELKQQNPLDPGVAFELGYLYYQNNQPSQAAEEFQVAAILDPGNPTIKSAIQNLEAAQRASQNVSSTATESSSSIISIPKGANSTRISK